MYSFRIYLSSTSFMQFPSFRNYSRSFTTFFHNYLPQLASAKFLPQLPSFRNCGCSFRTSLKLDSAIGFYIASRKVPSAITLDHLMNTNDGIQPFVLIPHPLDH